MSTYGVIQVGRVALREDSSLEVSLNNAGVALELSGQESYGRLSLPQLRQRTDDVVALAGQMLPVTFSQKNHLDGFYWVDEANGRYEEWHPNGVAIMPWSLRLTRVGYFGDTDLESQLAGPLTRGNDHVGALGERWHAPPLGHTGYTAGATVPSTLTRTTSEGAITVYRNIALDSYPRWAITPAAYGGGRCRLIDGTGAERQAVRAPWSPTGWSVHNGLVRLSVDQATGALDVAAWTGGAWQSKLWDLYHGTGPAVVMGTPTLMSVLRNDYETVAVRLVKALSPGRIAVDLILRRGSRFVEVVVQHSFGTTLKLVLRTPEAVTASTGYLRATSADAQGNRAVLGSRRTFTADAINGGLSRAATPTLDAFLGVEVAGAAAGDQAGDLFKQYLGATQETVKGERR